MLDEQSGPCKTGIPTRGTQPSAAHDGGWSKRSIVGHGGTGGASRFFYTAKASRSERGEGNTHPTVKPLKLCEHLARLLLPPGRPTPRRLLVPFSGSGSEMIGALRAGWESVVGIDNNPEYCELAKRRLLDSLTPSGTPLAASPPPA